MFGRKMGDVWFGAGALALLAVAGITPRVGFVRAFTLGWRNYFKKTYPLSVSGEEIEHLKSCIRHRGSYTVVIGEKGIGKSCVVDAALNRHCGVVKFSVGSEEDPDLIVDQALREIAGFEVKIKPTRRARRVLFFYSLLFKFPPIVVIRALDRQAGGLPHAARWLSDEFGLSVIVEGCSDSLHPGLLATGRETVIAVEPMSREQIESIPELEDLIGLLRKLQLDGPVWEVLGGSPDCYLRLKALLSSNAAADDVVIGKVKGHLRSLLCDALYVNVLKCSNASTDRLIKAFREKKLRKMELSQVAEMECLRDYASRVFRETPDYCLEPATAAVSLLISENIHDINDIDALLEKLYKKGN